MEENIMNRICCAVKRLECYKLQVGICMMVMLLLMPGRAAGGDTLKGKDAFAGVQDPAIQELFENPKMNDPRSILESFIQGEAASRVIVNLRKPAHLPEMRRFEDVQQRQVLKRIVRGVQERLLETLDSAAVRVTNRFRYQFAFSGKVTLAGLEELAERSDVVSIEKDRIVYANLAQGIPLINAASARSLYDGSGLAIAVCDTGIDYTHPKLGGGGFPNTKVIGGYDTGQNDADPMDGNGHGTACAGIAAGDLGSAGDYIGGVAHNARLYALKITDTTTGGSARASDMIEAWEWCITHQNDDPGNPILIISTSFGSGRYFNTCDSTSTAMTTAAANAVAAGMTLFVSSGNDGFCDAIGWPACISHVNAVGAVYDAHFTSAAVNWCVSAHSCASKISTSGCSTGWYAPDVPYEDHVTVYSNTATFLSMLAPANWATTTQLGGGYWRIAYGFGGTSAACPYAAGAAACLQNASRSLRGTYLTPAEVKTILRDTGDPVTDGKVDVTMPRVNLGNAISSLVSGISYVASSGSCGGRMPCYGTVQEAIDVAIAGDTIKIEQGTYAEHLTVGSQKDLTFSGGWDATFTAQPSTSTVRSLTLEDGEGSATVEFLILQSAGPN